uniref:T-cell surface glycoprotein CD3 zeta chain n=1 Tax=Oncorhynchus kisutch TaxID=8019 RepID=A0A8C7C9Z2_ONCKI
MTDSVLVCVPCLCFNGSWSSVWPAEASMTEPAICYILDGILLFYCIITTLLFVRAKVGHNTDCLPLWYKSSPEPKEDPTHAVSSLKCPIPFCV